MIVENPTSCYMVIVEKDATDTGTNLLSSCQDNYWFFTFILLNMRPHVSHIGARKHVTQVPKNF